MTLLRLSAIHIQVSLITRHPKLDGEVRKVGGHHQERIKYFRVLDATFQLYWDALCVLIAEITTIMLSTMTTTEIASR